MKTYKRALSQSAAARCEAAKHPRCRCRCGGRLHGIGHANYMAQERAILDEQKTIDKSQVDAIVDSLVEQGVEPAKQVNQVNHDNHANEIAV